MDNKRKNWSSNGLSGGDADGGRASKRRRGTSDFDLLENETPESTTAYGLNFLEFLRKTADKSGRPVATYFETLPPKRGNEEYYRKIRLPISLERIEQKLNNHEFATLTELEQYVKRMIINVKEIYPKSSQVFDDSERIRKALSNYMVKTNPAYKLIPGYSCQPTPLPEGEDSEAESDLGKKRESGNDAQNEEEDEGDGDGEDEDVEGEEVDEDDEKDAEDEDEDPDEEAEEDEPEEDEDEAEDESEEDAPPRQKRGRGRPGRPRGRPPKNAAQRTQPPSRYSTSGGKLDSAYEGVPYKGLTFQEAQEKILEELMRKRDEDEEYAYFEPFMNLPPRSLKDYFSVISDPLSLKGLQKLTKGIHGRREATGSSDFKGWTAFEEKSSLLWTNAHFYNEEGSAIYEMATELKEMFEEELAAAKAVVQEPPQPKIKLKLAQQQEPPSGSSKKITLHLANRSSSAGSPAPPTSASPGPNSAGGANSASGTRNPFGSLPGPGSALSLMQLDKARSVSVSAASPSPSVGARLESISRPSGVGPSPLGTPNGIPDPTSNTQQPQGTPMLNGRGTAMPGVPILPFDNKRRAPGKGLKDALLQSLIIRTHPAHLGSDRKFRFELQAHPTEAQQSVAVTVPAPSAQYKVQILARINPNLEQQQRSYRLFVSVNGLVLSRAAPVPTPDDPVPNNVLFFEAGLSLGVNWINVQLIAALQRDQRVVGGPDCELEKMFIAANVQKY